MGKAIILSENSGHFRRWANQFVNADPDNRGMVLVNPRRIRRNPTASQLIHYVDTYYAAAAQSAGRDGCVIVSLGHGGSHATDRTVGMVDLLPRRALRLQAEQLRYGGSEVEEGDLSVLRRLPDRRTCRRVLGAYDYNPRTRRPQPPKTSLLTIRIAPERGPRGRVSNFRPHSLESANYCALIVFAKWFC